MNRVIEFRAWEHNRKKMCYGYQYYIGDAEQNKYPLMQNTGMKDKNGKEIFEGDILQWTSSNPFSLGEIRKIQVSYVQAQYWGQGRNLGVYLAELLSNEKCEIVGNIYENGDVL